jgi:hypothetical protein
LSNELLSASRSVHLYIRCSGVCSPSLQGHIGLSNNLNLYRYADDCKSKCHLKILRPKKELLLELQSPSHYVQANVRSPDLR